LADDQIAKLADAYMALTIVDENDKRGFDLVHSARMDIRGKRIAIEAKRKELKSGALEYGRVVDGEAKRLTALLEPIEAHLEKQEAIVTAEAERKKAEKKAAEGAKLQARITALQALGAGIDFASIRDMKDDEYQIALAKAQAAFDIAEAKRKADKEAADKIAAEQEAERTRLAAAQAEAEKIRREAEAAKVAADKAIRDAQEAQRAAEAKAQAEKEKAAAVERARIEEAARIKAESEAKAKREQEAAKAEEERKAREEALRPEREKVVDLADRISAALLEKNLGPGSIVEKAVDIVEEAVDRLLALAKSE
jgi:hypothetical protein